MKTFDLLGMQMQENRRNLKTTLLHRPGGTWSNEEAGRIVNGLVNETSQHPQYPEHLVINGHYDEVRIRRLLPGGPAPYAFTVTQVTGVENLPFACFV